MVRSRVAQPQITEMGQDSSQLGHPKQPGMDESGTGKGKKSKSKKSRRDQEVVDPMAERAALEEESARALMQLSSSALHQDTGAPNFDQENDLQPLTQNKAPTAQDQASEQTHTKNVELGKSHKVDKKNEKNQMKKRKKRSNPDRKKRGELEDARLSTPPAERSKTPLPTHPLDQEPSDNEMMREYEAGVSQDQWTQIHGYSEQAPDNLENDVGQDTTEHPRQPSSVAQMFPNEELHDRNKTSSKRRKRQTGETTSDDMRSNDMPIDPDLHINGALLPSTFPDALDEIGSKFWLETQSEEHRRQRRVDKAEHIADEGDGHKNAYDQDQYQSGEGDRVFRGLEDEKSQLSRNLESPYPEDSNMDDLPWQANSKQKKSRKSEGPTPGGKGGFSADEITKLDNYRDQYCAANNLPIAGFNHLIQLNVRSSEYVVDIFNEIQDLFPYRTRSSVQRFCRRRFHNFHARGVWTPEEDADLKAAVALKGTSWKAIGDMLGRFSEDCRDRYRNYLAPSAENRNKDAWTETEVINLSHSILECMRRMKEERQRRREENAGHEVRFSDSDSDQEEEDLKLINWQAVSDLMGNHGTPRSRIQCSFKWSKIKQADRGRYLKEIKEAQKNLRNLERGDYTANNKKISIGWRLKAASKQVMNMKSGDKYDLLNAILDSAAPEEENIPWRLIGGENFRQRWSFSERKAGWLAMKKQIAGSEHMDYRQVVDELLADLLAHGVDQRWDPEVDGLVEGSPVKRPRQPKKRDNIIRKGKKRSKKDDDENEPQRPGPKSSEFVRDSDEDEGDVQTAPVPNILDPREHDEGSESPNSLFDGDNSPIHEPTRDPGVDESAMVAQRTAFGEVSPELAGRIHMLQTV